MRMMIRVVMFIVSVSAILGLIQSLNKKRNEKRYGELY